MGMESPALHSPTTLGRARDVRQCEAEQILPWTLWTFQKSLLNSLTSPDRKTYPNYTGAPATRCVRNCTVRRPSFA